ncbi:MAG: DUF2147 domain-containing protein [Pseudomonadota bacterium]
MTRPKILAIALTASFAASLAITTTAEAASPNGTWLRSKTGGHIKVFTCKGGLGMRVVKSKSSKKVGKVIMCGAKKTSANRWDGTVKNLDDGKLYKGIVKLQGSKLTLSGCVLGGIFCTSEAWSRLK